MNLRNIKTEISHKLKKKNIEILLEIKIIKNISGV